MSIDKTIRQQLLYIPYRKDAFVGRTVAVATVGLSSTLWVVLGEVLADLPMYMDV